MSHAPEYDELLRRLLRQTERRLETDPTTHLDEETLALFAEGALPANQREMVIAHLADCSDCREAASMLLSLPAEWATETSTASVVQPAPLIDPGQRRPTRATSQWSVAIAAATVLAVVGLWFGSSRDGGLADRQAYRRAETLLAQADFDGARDVLEQARRQGGHSDRLLSLESQAVRHLPGTLALATAGRLTSFGYDVDGTVARGPEAQTGLLEAGQLLSQAQNQQLEVLLNRGHWALASGQHEAAAKDFQQATELAPTQIWGWLGLGLARFHEDDFAAAANAFRRCLEIESKNTNARINLAMTLQEQDRPEEAKAIWETLRKENLTPADRQLVERALDALRTR